jgi:hypothetical protein
MPIATKLNSIVISAGYAVNRFHLWRQNVPSNAPSQAL